MTETFMQNKLSYTGQTISKEERSNWSTVGLLIIEKKQERVDGGGDDIFLRTIC